MKPNPTLIAAVAVCTATAFVIGRSGGPETDHPDRWSPGMADAPAASSDRVASTRKQRPIRTHNRSDQDGVAFTGDPITDMESIMSLSDPTKRAEVWIRFVRGLDATEVVAVTEVFDDRHSIHMDGMEYDALLAVWAKHDAPGALNYQLENDKRPQSIKTLLRTWATTNPDAAMEWVNENHEGYGTSSYATSVIRGIAAIDPAKAEALILDMPANSRRFDAVKYIVEARLRKDVEATREWAMSLQDERLKSQALINFTNIWSKLDPRATADWVITSPSENSRSGMYLAMREMAKQDPREAMSYFQGMSHPEHRKTAFTSIIVEITKTDSRAALDFMKANPSMTHDSSYTRLAWAGNLKQPEVIVEALNHVQNSQRRDQAYQQFMQRWLRSDFEAAKEWSQRNHLPESVRTQVKQQIELRGHLNGSGR